MGSDTSPRRGRLESWKEIAAHLGRDTSTVRRWEKAEGLPIHRHLHDKQATVYAYASELDAWLDSRRPDGPAQPQGRSGAEPRREVRLAVLPFDNLTGDPEQDYLVRGVHQGVLNELSREPALTVIARRSVMRYAGDHQPIASIARALGVDLVVEGSLQRADGNLRVGVRLVDGASEVQLWSDGRQVAAGDVLSLETALARSIASAVLRALSDDAPPRPVRNRKVSAEAYEDYLKGRFRWSRLSPEHLDAALEYFQRSLEKDPRLALAHVGIADTWYSRGDLGLVPPREAFARMKASVLDAIALDETLAEAHAALGNVRFVHDWDFESAENAFRRAIALNPGYADGHFFYADFLVSLGRGDEAEREMERALQLDPHNALYRCFRGWHLLYGERWDAALDELRRVKRTEPGFPAVSQGLWGAHAMKGDFVEALREAAGFFGLIGQPDVARLLSPGNTLADYRTGMKAAAAHLASRARKRPVGAVRVARLHEHAGDHAGALAWLERAFADREPALVHLAVGWDWRELRDHPGFQKLLDRLKLARVGSRASSGRL